MHARSQKDETADDRNRESEPQKEGTLEFSDAGLWDAEEMADFFEEHFSDSWQVYAQRDTAYYQTMILEQQSEKGGVRLMRENGVLKGFYAYALEEGLEVREPLYLNQFEGNLNGRCRCCWIKAISGKRIKMKTEYSNR